MINFEWYANYFKEYLSVTLGHFAKYVPPIFVNYYQNRPVVFDASSRSGYTAPSGVLSPNRFTKYIGVPVFHSDVMTYSVTSFDSRGVILGGDQSTITMFSMFGVIPKPDDHLTFPVFSDRYSDSSLYQVMNVEPAVFLTPNPFTEQLQAFKVTLTVDNNPVSTIESKVEEVKVYIDRFNIFLSPQDSIVWVRMQEMLSTLEKTLLLLLDRTTSCWPPFVLDVLYVSEVLFSSRFTTQRPIYESLNPPQLAQSVISGLCTFTGLGSQYVRPLESVLSNPDVLVLARWWNRGVYITVDSSTGTTIWDLLYPNTSASVAALADQILLQQQSQDWSLLLDPHPLAQIHNMYVLWVTQRELPTQTPATSNWLEMLFLYSVGVKVLEDIYGSL